MLNQIYAARRGEESRAGEYFLPPIKVETRETRDLACTGSQWDTPLFAELTSND